MDSESESNTGIVQYHIFAIQEILCFGASGRPGLCQFTFDTPRHKNQLQMIATDQMCQHFGEESHLDGKPLGCNQYLGRKLCLIY